MARLRALLGAWETVHLRVHAVAGGGIETPFAGSLLRGAFGASLYRLVCVRKGIPCGSCFLWNQCFYPFFFDPPPRPSGLPGTSLRGPTARPFALLVPERIRPGEVVFEIKLFAIPQQSLAYLLLSLVEMGRAGVGRDRVPFELARIESLAPGEAPAPIYVRERGLFPQRTCRFPVTRIFDGGTGGGEAPEAPGSRSSVALEFRTPLRMKEGGRIRSGFGPERMVRAALRRLSDLGASLGQSWPRAWPGAIAASREVLCLGERTRWLDWGRYSRRQGRAMRLGGAVGRVEYREVPTALVALLRTACFAQLGKNTTFGLGVVELQEGS